MTVFEESLLYESLWGEEQLVRDVFDKAIEIAEELGIVLKLPHLLGEDVAGDRYHKDCFVAWRVFFLAQMVMYVHVYQHV